MVASRRTLIYRAVRWRMRRTQTGTSILRRVGWPAEMASPATAILMSIAIRAKRRSTYRIRPCSSTWSPSLSPMIQMRLRRPNGWCFCRSYGRAIIPTPSRRSTSRNFNALGEWFGYVISGRLGRPLADYAFRDADRIVGSRGRHPALSGCD
jgi:hypothetical protein